MTEVPLSEAIMALERQIDHLRRQGRGSGTYGDIHLDVAVSLVRDSEGELQWVVDSAGSTHRVRVSVPDHGSRRALRVEIGDDPVDRYDDLSPIVRPRPGIDRDMDEDVSR